MLQMQKGVFTFQTAFGQPLPSCAPRAGVFLLSTISFARTLDPQRAPHRRTSAPDASSSLHKNQLQVRLGVVCNHSETGAHSAAAIHMFASVAHQLQRVHFQTLLPVHQFSYSKVFHGRDSESIYEKNGIGMRTI